MSTAIGTTAIANLHHPIVSRQQWLAERKALLAREKELTRLGDEIARERRALPWVRMEKDYLFDTADVYSQGMSEEILGQAVAGRRDKVMISTKATFPMGEGPNDLGSGRLHLVRAC